MTTTVFLRKAFLFFLGGEQIAPSSTSEDHLIAASQNLKRPLYFFHVIEFDRARFVKPFEKLPPP